MLRSDFPAAIAAAAAGRYRLLAILVDHAVYGAVPNATVDNPLFFDTECEELPFPWVRTDPPAPSARPKRSLRRRPCPPGLSAPSAL